MHDLIIIGGGPAGLAAAAYALGKKLDVMLVCAGFGGKASERQYLARQGGRVHLIGEESFTEILRTVAAHPTHILDASVTHMVKYDEMFHVTTNRATLQAPAVILATGAQPATLGVDNEQLLVGHGLGYSVATHARLAAGREVAVVGSTTRALRGVAELVQMARHVVLVAPTPGELGSLLGRRLRADPRVDILDGYSVVAVESNAGAVQAIMVSQGDIARRLPVQAVFVALGLVPNTDMVSRLVTLDENGFVVVDDRNRTSRPGLFAAGDVTSSISEQVMIAIGEGVRAAQSAYDYILAQRLGLDSGLVRATIAP
jgi:thioredoxin reductase